MRVLFLQQQPCIRALKYAVGLRAAREDWRLGFAYQGKTLSEWYGSGDELFERWWDLGDDPAGALPAVLAEFRPDVVHSHNLPDSLTVLAHEVADGRAPVIHDVHDLQSLRQTPYEHGFPEPRDPLELERQALEESDAVVAVSDELLAAITARYRLEAPTLVFANYALRRDLPEDVDGDPPDGRPPRLVYQGTLSTNDGHYDLREIFRELVATGATLDVYPSREVPEYRALARDLQNLAYHETIAPAALLQTLPRYDFGWAGFNDGLNRAHIDTALPNKLFEYLACGLPVLTLDHRAIRRFLTEHGLGIALESPSDLPAALARCDVTELRRRVAAARFAFTVEANIDRLADLYEEVVR